MTEPIEPDTKDWTWVLQQPCPECGLDASSIRGTSLSHLVPAWVERWQDVLERPGATSRPAATVWSPLEYACHVRDVFTVFDERVRLMLTEDAPTFPNWDQDETALERRYADQAPALVSDELAEAGAAIAARFASVDGEQWQRPGLRSNGSAFTVETLGQYFAHDVVHHLHDVHA
ncbi:DinB family protein [Cellulomonas sp. APG4]|uniref:DinB family protein n=1 Tax=Cellulomonas sp. APG4 TaxID=1538656 RepID=UPI00137A63F5|nr:DinB family protein [Cellulomonas sp. APG4]NCT92405.1 DinB family protein [Cellulomonas sp. APG4]